MRRGVGGWFLVFAPAVLAGRLAPQEPAVRAAALAPRTVAVSSTARGEPDACGSVLTEVDARLAATSLDLPERNPLYARVRGAARDAVCAEAIAHRIAAHPCGTAPSGVITAALLASEGATSALVLTVVERAESQLRSGSCGCMIHAIGAVQGSRVAGLSVAQALLRGAVSWGDPASKEAAWLALGSVARSAALRGDAEVVELVEAKLEARLAAARGPELVPFLEAAGNAGCAACVPAIARAATHPSAEVRRVAAAARRFDGTEGAVSSMCGALRGDEAEPVREHAAWALGHLMTHLHLRRACLVNAAQGDESESVRAAARNALGTLGIPQPVEASDPSRSL